MKKIGREEEINMKLVRMRETVRGENIYSLVMVRKMKERDANCKDNSRVVVLLFEAGHTLGDSKILLARTGPKTKT